MVDCKKCKNMIVKVKIEDSKIIYSQPFITSCKRGVIVNSKGNIKIFKVRFKDNRNRKFWSQNCPEFKTIDPWEEIYRELLNRIVSSQPSLKGKEFSCDRA